MTAPGPRPRTEGVPSLWGDGDDGSVLVWRLASPRLVASSAPLGGGVGVRHWIVNAQVPLDYGRLDPAAHLADIAGRAGLMGEGVGMLTAADVRALQRTADGGVRVDATVGITHPTWAADGDPEDADAAAGATGVEAPAGTINIVASIPARLADAAIVNAVATVAEAKAQALWDAGIGATGTASDAVCLVTALDGPSAAFGGPRSTWGARLARAVHRAVLAGCRAEAGRA